METNFKDVCIAIKVYEFARPGRRIEVEWRTEKIWIAHLLASVTESRIYSPTGQ